MKQYVDVSVRNPDFVDPVEGTQVWFDEVGAVEIPLGQDPAQLAYLAGWHAKNGETPESLGVRVTTHNPDHIHATVSWIDQPSNRTRVSSAWATAFDVMGGVVNVAVLLDENAPAKEVRS